MNKTAIKNFAIWARNKLIKDIQYKAGLIGITEEGMKSPLAQSTGTTQFFDIGSVEPFAIHGVEIGQREKLVDLLKQKASESDYVTAYKYIMEEVAYTWFNRLIAIRFMEVNDYLPSHVRVLSSETGKMEPDIVTNPFDAELEFTGKEERLVIQLQQDNKIDELFRMLFVKQCNALNEILPALFEKTDDYMELLLNLSVIDKEGVVYRLVNDIPEEDFDVERGGQVEIIGWLYQYYNTEPKNEAFAKKSKITKDEIPAVTQLFTPDWIVRYMVENSLGRLWLDGHPDDALKSQWKYYLDEAEQEPEVQVKLEEIRREHAKLNPEDIKLIDPCMGSGHILVYAFDVLMQIYESVGWSQREAAKSILENNIYGLDIDDRAGQMAYFAIMMKARQYNRRIFSQEIEPHVYAIQESNGIKTASMQEMGTTLSQAECAKAVKEAKKLVEEFHDAKEYGSIIDVVEHDWDLLKRFAVPRAEESGQMTLDIHGEQETAERLQKLIKIGKNLAQKYEVVVTNPPYMGSSGMNGLLTEYLKKKYSDSKSDLFAVFIERCELFARNMGYVSMITQHAWMFISSYEELRKKILCKNMISLVHLGIKAFEEIGNDVVQTCSFVFRNSYTDRFCSSFVKLDCYKNYIQKENEFFNIDNRCINRCDDFGDIPGVPYAYYVSRAFIDNFKKGKSIVDYGTFTGSQNITGDNERYLKLHWEINSCYIGDRWHFYAKGGDYRQYYGNLSYVIDWSETARCFYANNKTSNLLSEDLWYKPGITYSAITSRGTGFRYLPEGCIFDKGGPSIQINSEIDEILALLNSNVAKYYFWVFNPSINLQVKDVKNFPIILTHSDKTIDMASHNLELCIEDWNSVENASGFKTHPLIKGYIKGGLIASKFAEWEAECFNRFNQLKENEEKLNRIFIETYELQKELTSDVEERDVTVRKADLQRDIKSLLSYAVGCMFGRYSLDNEGLIYAGGKWDSRKYSTFIPDEDGIIPITDEEYFEDDIVGLFCGWLKKVYGKDTLEENLDFIAKALGKKGSSSREIIRNYFLTDFFKDHCSTYSVTGSGKRPIYWLFDSGKQNGFKALIYLHRYTPDTIGDLRVDYLHRMQRVYESEINRMQDMMDHSSNRREVATATKRKEKLQKQLKECRDYDEKIGHLALSRVELDLDDGVKYNYRKVQTANDGKFYEVLANSKAIMMDAKKYREFKK